MALQSIPIDQLAIGLKVHLDLPWMKHPFLRSTFVIKDEAQIRVIRKLGLSRIDYDPDKSRAEPRPSPATTVETPSDADEALQALWEAKEAQIRRCRERRERQLRCESLYASSVAATGDIHKGIATESAAALHAAEELVAGMVCALAEARELTLNLVNAQGRKKNDDFHAVNVAVLSLILGKRSGMDEPLLHKLGMAALLHDIGKIRLPDRVRDAHPGFTQGERNAYKSHAGLGVHVLQQRGLHDAEIAHAIAHHHELSDGSGFPDGLTGPQISSIASVIAIANRYDNLCNPKNQAKALGPYETMSLMYSRLRSKFDARLLPLFINSVGVYPPGTFVRLSNQAIGMVLSVNPDRLLYPNVLIYDRHVPRKEAMIVDLQEEDDLSITESLPGTDIPAAVREYLNPGLSANYYFDAA